MIGLGLALILVVARGAQATVTGQEYCNPVSGGQTRYPPLFRTCKCSEARAEALSTCVSPVLTTTQPARTLVSRQHLGGGAVLISTRYTFRELFDELLEQLWMGGHVRVYTSPS